MCSQYSYLSIVGNVPSSQKILQTLEFRILLYICKSLIIICNAFFGKSQSDLLLRRKSYFFGCKKCNRKCVSVGQFFVLRTKNKIKCNATSLHLTNNISTYTELTYFILLIIAPAYSRSRNMW